METALRELPSQLIAQVNELILSKPHEAVDKHVDLIRGAIDVDIVDVNTVLTSRRFYRSSETAVGHPVPDLFQEHPVLRGLKAP